MKIEVSMNTIFDALYDGVLIADKNCVVKYVNPSYTRITGVESKDIVGTFLMETRPGAILPSVIKSGKQQLRIPRKVGNVEYFVNMVPIIDGDEITGGISILNEINDVYKLTEALDQSNKMIQKLRKHINKVGKAKYRFEDIVSLDEQSKEAKRLAQKIASKDSNVLITGESGTGKELYANAIHNASQVGNGPFVPVNCATFEGSLLESELFGYEEGSFTGAKKGGKIGLFEVANGGTLFLDEISELHISLQGKLLRTLQEGTVRRVGGIEEIPINIRLICATNKSLEDMVSEGTFRRDLYYRIAVFPISIPPLRDRKNDIDQLVHHFLKSIEKKTHRNFEMTDGVMQILYGYDWPGNIRELKNAVEFSVNMTEGNLVKPEHLPKMIQMTGLKNNIIQLKKLDDIIKEVEVAEIKKHVSIFGNTLEGKKKAAKTLGISLATLYNKLKE